MANGDTRQVQALLPGFKPHLIVADLPYGIQHQGQLIGLLQEALPVWLTGLRRGGALALAWDATRFPRETMLETLQPYSELTLLTTHPYDQLAHQVDRVIKLRDVVVARRV